MKKTDLEILIEPLVLGFGFSFEGIQQLPQGKYSLVRLYIDKPGGVTIDDCERVARQIDASLEVEFPNWGNYTLEVSSPGLDRLLFSPDQFKARLGQEISVRLAALVSGRRNFKGLLQAVQADSIQLKVDQDNFSLPFADIIEARVVPDWSKSFKGKGNVDED